MSSLGHTTLTVGQSPGCNWVVREEGVAPVHFSLHWDGSSLRIADVYGAGGVRVDGALVGNQWRVLSGRVRIDFGKAAVVVEAGTAPPIDFAHGDPSPLPPVRAGSSAPPPGAAPVATAGARPNSKVTLLGVAPVDVASLPAHFRNAAEAATPAPGSERPLARDEDRGRRPNDSERPHKPTLVGLPVEDSSATAHRAGGPASSVPPKGPLGSGTLLGVGLTPPQGVPLRSSPPQAGQPVPGGSLADGDQRTIQGFPMRQGPGSEPPSQPPGSGIPGRRATQKGMFSEAPGVQRGAVAQAPMRPVSSAPPPGQEPERIGSTWQEVPEDFSAATRAEDVPQAVLLGDRTLSDPRFHASSADRYSDAPTQMRDMATLESRRPKRQFPWRYVGVGVLTMVAYFAWLYLLEHI